MGKSKLSSYAALGTAGLLGLMGINHTIRKKALRHNILHPEKGSFYEWKYGKIFYQFSGRGSDKLLLIHDANVYGSGAEWNRMLSRLKDRYMVYTIDLPGCGRSDKPGIEYTSFLFVNLIHSFIRDVIQDKTEIWAAGLSGPLAVHSAYMDPSMISSVTLINPCPPGQFALVPDRNAVIRRRLIDLPVIGEAIYEIVNRYSNLTERFAEKLFFNPFHLSKKVVDTAFEALYAGNGSGRHLMASQEGRIFYMNVNRAFAKLQVPVRIIVGDKAEKGKEAARAYAKLNKKVTVCTIPKTGQLPHLENPQEFCKVL